MSAIVDYAYYSGVYMGSEADEASFPALCARAEDVAGAVTRWQVTEDNIDRYPALIQTLYRKAVCAQVDFFAVNGPDSLAIGRGGDAGFTVGKVSVRGRGGDSGAMRDNVAPMALAFLEQTGLMEPAVPTLGGW